MVRNGLSTVQVPVVSDPFTVEVPMIRSVDGGPLGTFYRVDVREPTGIRSIVSNPIWLAAAPPDDPEPGTSAPYPRYRARPRRPRTEAAPGPPSRPRAATRWRAWGCSRCSVRACCTCAGGAPAERRPTTADRPEGPYGLPPTIPEDRP